MKDKTKKMLDLIRFLDEARWKGSNYDTPYYADEEGMSFEQKLLTHFLGYITNRQISYKLVFDKLDFIFSQLVEDFEKGKNVDGLLEKYLKPQKDKKGKYKWKFTERPLDEKIQNSESNSLKITAASRYISSDIVAIYCTLKILSQPEYNGSFFEYMKCFLNVEKKELKLESLLYGLWLLGYSDIGQWKNKEPSNVEEVFSVYSYLYKDNGNKKSPEEIIKKLIEKKQETIKGFFTKPKDNKTILTKFHDQYLFQSKRLTCFVRDLLKCRDFSEMFSDKFPDEAGILKSQLHKLELPGDVWNNNEHFQKCFDQISEFPNKKKTTSFNKRVREFYANVDWEDSNPQNSVYYPEQFDTTFDFVPRMCEASRSKNCRFCPLEEKSNGRIPDELCLGKSPENEQKFCPFLLYACGYKVKCEDIKNFCPNKEQP